MHEANFELIEIPHVRQSGKNSAEIRLVVDALDLCYTKSHVNTFVIVSGDSDFSPLVSKLRENDKYVIGVGVKQSTSDLLIANCDEFIFYDDLVREIQRSAARRDPKSAQPSPKRSAEEDKRRKDEIDARKSEAVELAVSTYEALVTERGDGGKIWASMLKNAIKRRKPDFNESYYGFRVFGNLLDEAQARGLLEVGRDEKSGAFVSRSLAAPRSEAQPVELASAETATVEEIAVLTVPEATGAEIPASVPVEPKRRSRGGSKRSASAKAKAQAEAGAALVVDVPALPQAPAAEYVAGAVADILADAVESKAAVAAGGEAPTAPDGAVEPPTAEVRPEKKPASRNRRPRKPKAAPEAAG